MGPSIGPIRGRLRSMSQLNFLKSRPAFLLTALLVVQGSLFYGFSRGETPPVYKPLDKFPDQVGGWRMVQQGVMEQEVKDVLRADDYVTRDYAASPTKVANLFVAFFKSQRAGFGPFQLRYQSTLLDALSRSRSIATLFRRVTIGL
jgi:hypothetical protein